MLTESHPMHTTRSVPDYPLGQTLPDTGHTLEVAPGVHWLRMGLPFALDHINLWLLRDSLPAPDQSTRRREGWTVVDCGIDNPATRQAWQQIEANVLQGLPVLRVIVTHMHPDHMGLAHWLCERWQAPLWMSTTEYQAALLASSGQLGFGSTLATRFFASHGWTREADQHIVREHVSDYAAMVPQVPSTHVRLIDGMHLHIGDRGWRCLSGLGHSPEHMALLCEDEPIFISGDMLLPSISSNVSVHAQEPDGNPLGHFLNALTRMQSLPADVLTLPSHGRPFVGAHARLAQLQAHHEERLQELLQACSAGPRSAHELLGVLFKRALNPQQMAFAMGEAVAHLNALWHEGRLTRQHDTLDGIYRFESVA